MPSTKELLALANQEDYTLAPNTVEVRVAGASEISKAKVLPSVGAIAVRNAGYEISQIDEVEVQQFADSIDSALIPDIATNVTDFVDPIAEAQYKAMLARHETGDDCGWE